MSVPGSLSASRKHSGDRFYNPPAIRRHQEQLLLSQQQQPEVQRPENSSESSSAVEVEVARDDTDDSTFSNRTVTSPIRPVTNIDLIVESVTPFVPALCFSKGRLRGLKARESDMYPHFSLGDLWESFKEWSVYGVEVPLKLSDNESIKQYYVPSLSGIQLYIDPRRVRRPGEESSVKSLSGSADNLINMSSQRMECLSLRDEPLVSSSSDEAEVSNSPGLLKYEFLELDQPYLRQPLFDKISFLASRFPELKTYKSCDLLPSSWVCVAWYPIYRIPVGSTLQNLDASFLSFHSLSTHSRGKKRPQFHSSPVQKISLPVFGLASYKLRSSILAHGGDYEKQQANTLLQAADTWLRSLQRLAQNLVSGYINKVLIRISNGDIF